MALIFPILTQFDDRAAKKADTTFTKLGKKFAAVFSVASVVKFGKASVRAFQEAETEAAQLRAQLEAVNLAFASDFLNEYVDNLALLSGITGGDLNRAFITLSQATEDVTTAQKLLNASLDIAAGSSKDLQTVANALQRAYAGEVTALARLRIGYTTAELKGRDFNDVLDELTEKFQGASARSADTLAGKMARLAEATDQAKEAFGAGFVKGIEDSNVAVEDLQKTVIDLGDAFGYATGKAISFYQNLITDVTASIEESDSVFAKLVKGLVKNQVEASRLEEERGRATLRQRNAILKAEQKNLKTRKEAAKLSDQEKKNAEKLAKAKTMFDMEQIQIAAALQGKLTDEERTRLKLMQAIIEENVDETERLTEKLQKLQEETAKLATSLTDFEAPDPFGEWDKAFARIFGYLEGVAKINPFAAWPDTLKNIALNLNSLMTQVMSLQSSINTAVLTAQGRSASAAENVAIAENAQREAYEVAAAAAAASAAAAAAAAAAAQKEAAEAIAKAEAERAAAQAAIAAAQAAGERAAAERLLAQAAAAAEAAKAFKEAADAAAAAAIVEEEGAVAAEEAYALITAEDALRAEMEAMFALLDLGLLGGINVTVNVEGNAITQDDLVEVITDQLYQDQKTGKGLLFSSRAI